MLSGRWHSWHERWKIGAMSSAKVTRGEAPAAGCPAAAGASPRTMIAAPAAALERRAKRIAKAAGPGAVIQDGTSAIGGGTLPGEALPTRVVAIPPGETGVEAMAAALRAGSPPIVARIERDALIIDPRTVLPEQDATVAVALTQLRP